MTYQDPKQSNTYYYVMFKSIKGMVMAYIGQLGYHLKLYGKHWKRLMVMEGIVDKQVIDTSKREEYVQLMMYFSCKEFCSFLYVCQSNNKFYKRPK